MKKIRRINFIGGKDISILSRRNHKNPPQKLIRLFKTLNNSYREKNYENCYIQIRTILNHIPSIFGFSNIDELISQIKNEKSVLKSSVKRIHETFKNLADDELHKQASKFELRKGNREVLDNHKSDLKILLEGISDQLLNNDFRDSRVQESTNKKTKNKLQLFEQYIEEEQWRSKNIDNKNIWICERDELFQIHEQNELNDFSNPWTTIYPHKNGSWNCSVYLMYNNNIIETFMLIYCDGGRVFFVMPDTDTADSKILEPNPKYYWVIDSLKYKLNKFLIDAKEKANLGEFDSLGTVARRSKIEIRANY